MGDWRLSMLKRRVVLRAFLALMGAAASFAGLVAPSRGEIFPRNRKRATEIGRAHV